MTRCTDTCCRGDDSDIEVVRLGRTYPRSRTLRTCADCGGPIPAGTPYVRTGWKVDGEVAAVATHTESGACAGTYVPDEEYEAILREEADMQAVVDADGRAAQAAIP